MKKKTIKKPITKDPDQEFEKYFMNTDFGGSGIELLPVEPRKAGRPKIGRKLSIVLPDDLIKRLERVGKSKGVGYQTMIRIICAENIDDYERPQHAVR